MLDQLEPVEKDQEVFRPVSALYPWPLGLALFGSLLLGLIDLFRQRGGRR